MTAEKYQKIKPALVESAIKFINLRVAGYCLETRQLFSDVLPGIEIEKGVAGGSFFIWHNEKLVDSLYLLFDVNGLFWSGSEK